VQAARNLITAFAELAAGMQHRHDDFDRGLMLFGVDVDRNSAPVVFDRHRAVRPERHVDFGRVTCHRFINGVINGLIDELMQSALRGIADVHPRAFADGL